MGLNVITSPTTFTGGLTASWDNIITSQPLLSSLAGTEEILISDGIVSKKTTAQAIADLGGGSITTSTTPPVSPSAGDLWFNSESGILYVYYDDGNSQQWVAADNNGSGGKVAQVVYTEDATRVSTTIVIPRDNTIPQDNEGAAYSQLDTTITPTNASSRLLIQVVLNMSSSSTNTSLFTLFRTGSSDAIQVTQFTSTGDSANIVYLNKIVLANNTDAQTFKVRFGTQVVSFTTGINNTLFNSMLKSTMTITEILP